MEGFFAYQTLEVHLYKETKTLAIYFKQDSSSLKLEQLFELESLLAFASNKVEISSILITVRKGFLSLGIDQETLKSQSKEQLERYSRKIQKLSHAFCALPQTVVVDFHHGCDNVAIELFSGADLWITHSPSEFKLNHLNIGITPSSGGLSLLPQKIGINFLKSWFLSAKKITGKDLLATGAILFEYQGEARDILTHELLASINTQSTVARLQTKLGLYPNQGRTMDELQKFEREIGMATIESYDWSKSSDDFTDIKEFKKKVKLKLIKTPEVTN